MGGMPPIQSPFFLEAAILSRMRSPVTSRSNWANDSNTFSVRRPIEPVGLNCWVTDTNETSRSSKRSTSLAKARPRRARDRAGNRGQAAVVIAVVVEALVQNGDTVRSTVPLAQQLRTRGQR